MFLSEADLVICLSKSWLGYYRQNFTARRLVILSNIIDYPVKNIERKKQDELILLFLGLISNAKGIFDLIEVIKSNKDIYKGKLKLLIGGNGEIQHLKDIIVKDEMEEIIEYLGWITNSRKAEVLYNSDVFVLPSYNEGLPISILEAMSYGKPVISTNVGGIPEIVSDNRNGVLVNPGDQSQIERAINLFLKNPDLVTVYGSESEKMVSKYLPEEVIAELEKLYKSLL